jgi:hypothetical protein
MTCSRCASMPEMVSVDQAFEWVRRDAWWWEPGWWTERRIDKAMAVREQGNRDYRAAFCRGFHEGGDTNERGGRGRDAGTVNP